MRILCHICCAPCYLAVGKTLTDAGHKVEGFFYNPNIHPLIEFRRRLKSVRVLQEQLKFPLRAVEEYGLRRFLRLVAFREDQSERCPLCYRQRLYRTAQHAAENGYDAFTTTLLSSTHQDHNQIAEIGREAAARAGSKFYYQDFRPDSKAAHEEAKRRQLYLQNYCGCIYSEYERYRDTTKELYKGKG
ncbi:MAG: epoxyqueuosine reductase QueH [Planctomycetota bacterium]